MTPCPFVFAKKSVGVCPLPHLPQKNLNISPRCARQKPH